MAETYPFTLQDLLVKIPTMTTEEHPSVDDVLNQQGADFTLKGKTVLVTGGSSGIGVDTVRAFASRGARVFVAVRDVDKTRQILDGIAASYPNNGGLEIIHMELESLSSVNTAADEFIAHSSQLHILVNNAGVMNTPYQLTKDGHEYQFGVNHLGHFLLIKRLVPLLLKSSTPQFNSRVVILTSYAHNWGGIDLTDLHFKKRGYTPSKAYAQSKTADVLIARELEHRYGSQGVHAWAVHPGAINTDLQRHSSPVDYIRAGFFNDKGDLLVSNMKWKTTSQGAATSVWAAVSKELEGKGGEYLEDAHIGRPKQEGKYGGYSPHAYDDETGHKLWEYSEEVIKPFISQN